MNPDPIFDKLEYLRPNPPFWLFKSSGGPPIPHRERIRAKRPWENWLYGVVRDVNQMGVGTVKVYRDGHKIGSAPVADWQEADRIFEEAVEAAKEATAEYEEKLT